MPPGTLPVKKSRKVALVINKNIVGFKIAMRKDDSVWHI
jgi:hypothetical protein